MKATKPEHEKYFKDVVLNNILKEIAHENGTNLQKPSSNPTKRINTYSIWLPLIALVAIVSAAFFTTNTTIIQTSKQETAVIPPQANHSPSSEPQKGKQSTAQQQTTVNSNKVVSQPTLQDKEATRMRQTPQMTVQEKQNTLILLSKPAKNLNKPTPMSEHERAKAALLQQMKE